jgi:SAM-dependent methyltransferase
MDFPGYYRWLVIKKYLRIKPSSTSLLDVGCGDGYFLSQTKAALKAGVDLNPPPAEEHYSPVIKADACHLPFARGTFDNIFAFDIIEHIQDDTTFLNAIVDVLAEGGTIWLSTPLDRFKIFPPFVTKKKHRDWGHVREGYSSKELQEKMPLEVEVSFRYWNEPVFRASYYFCRLLAMVSPALANKAMELCAWLDNIFAEGLSGHIFAEIRKT